MLGSHFPQWCVYVLPSCIHRFLTKFSVVGWISTLRALGDALNIEAFYTLHLIFVCIMCATWLVLAVFTAVAFWKGEIFLAKDEDVAKDKMWESERRRPSESSETTMYGDNYQRAHGIV